MGGDLKVPSQVKYPISFLNLVFAVLKSTVLAGPTPCQRQQPALLKPLVDVLVPTRQSAIVGRRASSDRGVNNKKTESTSMG